MSHDFGKFAFATLAILIAGACSPSSSSSADDNPSAVQASTYPAFKDVTLPQIGASGGPVIASPVIVPVVFPGIDPAESSEFVRLLTVWSTSASWHGAVSEYGVGAARVTKTLVPADLPPRADPKTLTDDEIKQYLKTTTLDPAPSKNTLYALFFPKDLVVTGVGGGEVCGEAGGGYHDLALLDDGTAFAYSVLRRCPFEALNANISREEVVTSMGLFISHEIVEGVTDPFVSLDAVHKPGGPWRAFHDVANPDWAWGFMFAGEVADMCNNTGPVSDMAVKPTDLSGFSIQRTWSNAEAKLFHDPCVPHDATPYMAAAPQLTETLKLAGQEARVVRVTQGTTSKPIDVKLVSTGPTDAWTVRAEQLGGIDIEGTTLTRWQMGDTTNPPKQRLSYAWDRTTGKNGDILKLTVTALPDAPAGLTVFQVISKLGDRQNYWIAAAYTGTGR